MRFICMIKIISPHDKDNTRTEAWPTHLWMYPRFKNPNAKKAEIRLPHLWIYPRFENSNAKKAKIRLPIKSLQPPSARLDQCMSCVFFRWLLAASCWSFQTSIQLVVNQTLQRTNYLDSSQRILLSLLEPLTSSPIMFKIQTQLKKEVRLAYMIFDNMIAQ